MRLAAPEMFRSHLDGRLPSDVETVWYRDRSDVADAARDADVFVMGFVERDDVRFAVESACNARWISTHAAGVDHYPLDQMRARGIQLTNGSGAGAVPIAESVVMYILSAAKSLPHFLRNEWPTVRPPALELEGTRALILGYGAIGGAVGERLRPFGVEVTAVRRSTGDEWRTRLGEFDWIILTVPLTGETRHLIGERELHRMKPSAWLFNVARGGLIDQDALVAALQAGQPHGAYLDVTEPEPLPADHALWSLPNVFITGHSSGRGTRTTERYVAQFLDNLARYRTGRPLRNPVDLEGGY